ncbi:hypothetical protein RvY_17530 [Ramazzottius varieornatus]|uniref:DNA helicase n=1 Tax=Ramazzottius varieornatus TaxID=947166 RepID=A0A1D1W4K5_RAMVA|nr:hypothetical protein RvY_17530 [Ramazzottius varieornatus]
MTENSYMSLFSDPSSDFFNTLTPNGEESFSSSGLQPSIVSTVASYQPLEAESIMTLGEPSPSPSKASTASSMYAQLGGGLGSLGGSHLYSMPHSAYAPHGQPSHPSQRLPHHPTYFTPGSLTQAAFAQQTSMQPQRFGHEHFRHASPYQGYPPLPQHGNPSGGMTGVQGGNGSSWPSGGTAYLQQSHPPMRQYGSAPLIQGGYAGPAMTAADGSQSHFLPHAQQAQMNTQQSMQAMRAPIHSGYSQPMAQYPPPANGMQYPAYGQPPPRGAMPAPPTQQRLPAMPYAGPQSMQRFQPASNISAAPQMHPPSKLPQQQQQQSMFMPMQRPPPPIDNTQRSPSNQPGHDVNSTQNSRHEAGDCTVPRPTPPPQSPAAPAEPRNSSAMSSSSAAPASQAQSPVPRSPHQSTGQDGGVKLATDAEASPPKATMPSPMSPHVQSAQRPQQHPFPGMNMMANGVASPGPSNAMMQNHNRMATASYPPGQGPMMQQAPQQMFPPMEGGGHAGQGYYANGPQMMAAARPPSIPAGQPASFTNIAAEIHQMKQSLNTYMTSGQRNAAIDNKIVQIRQKIDYLEKQQAAAAPHGLMRMAASGPMNGNLRPAGMAAAAMVPPSMQMLPGGPAVMMSHPMSGQGGPPTMEGNHRDPQRPGIPPPNHNGFPTNGMSSAAAASAPPSQASHSPPHEGGFSAELTSSQESEDESANKYASPKKKRNSRNRASSSRKRKAKADSADSATKSPAKSRSRPKAKAKTAEKSSFQFGKKSKKKKGSDDEGDDIDATPPPSPRAPPLEQEFDGEYVEKRRSTRAVKKKKYNDEDNDQAEVDMLLAPIVEINVAAEFENGESLPADSQMSDSTMAESVEATRKYFVEPGDSEPIVVEKVMADRMGERPVKKDDGGEKEGEGDKQETIPVEEFYVKFKSYSYLHCDWKTVAELEVIDKRIKQKVQRYKQKKETRMDYMEEADEEPFDPNYTEVDRILDEKVFPHFADNEDVSTMRPYFLCKWVGLPYDECTWEVEEDCDSTKIAEYRLRQVPPPPAERKRIPRPKARDWKKMEAGMVYKNGNTLRDYQLEGVNWLLFSWYHGQNCILADEMGLGKTVQSTVFLEHVRRYGIRGPFLVVVPLSTLGNWSREVETWTDMNGICYHGGSTTREIIRHYEFYYKNDKGQKLAGIHKFNIFITTYEILLADIYELREIEWRAVVIDEAHRLKNMKCKLLEGLKLLDLEHRVLLTGTPLQNNVEELFSLLHFLEPERFSNMEAFSLDFGNLKTDDQVTKLQQILKPMMLRRLKEDVEKSIAPKEETIIEVELTNMQKKWYRAILEKNFAFLQKGSNTANVPNLMNTMMELRKCCNHPYLLNGAEDSIIEDMTAAQGAQGAQDRETLLKALVQSSGKLVLIDKLLPKLKEGGHKVLIFSQMVRCLDILEDYLVQKRHSFERIDGRVRGPDRQAAIDRFSRDDSDRFVFLLCTRAGGLGINLTAADTVIIFDSDWNPQNDLQAQARCHRIGQDKPVKIYRLITHNSYEREMFDKASLKLGLDKAVLQSGQMTGKSDSHAGGPVAPQLSKNDVEDLLKRGAYGALMEDDAAGDQFCTEDIEQILQRRTQTVQLEAGEKGSTFSKATFAATGTRDDIDINDPDFWQKWAKKAEIQTDKDAFENDLIIHEPRKRAQVKRYGEELEDEADDASDDDYDSDEEDGKGRRGRKGKKGRGGKEEDRPRAGNWLRTECLRLEKALLAWGWGRWKEIVKDCNFKRHFSEKDVEIFGRTLVHYCCKQYSGSDDKAKPYIWNLVQYAYMDDWEQRKAQAFKLKEAAGQLEDTEAPSSSRSAKRNRKSAKKAGTPEEEAGSSEQAPDWENDGRFDPEKLLDDSFLKHMKKHSVNRLILRLKLLESLKEEVIQDLGDMIMADTAHDEVPLDVPAVDSIDKPMEWWDDEADKSLLMGVYKHGYERYNDVRNDPKLCFLKKCGPAGQPVASVECEVKETTKDSDGDGDSQETEEPTEAESTDAGSDGAEGSKKKSRQAKNEKAKEESVKSTAVKPGRGRRPNAAKRAPPPSEAGQVNFPTDPDLNTRVRRLIVAFEKRRLRAEQMEVKRQQRLEKQMQADREREAKRLEQQQKKWSKREEGDFLKAISLFGVEFGANKEELLWDRFREVSKLDKKLDKTLTEYYKCFIAMIRKVCGKKLNRDEEGAAAQVDAVAESKAQLCLQRIELLNKVRMTALRHSKLDDRLRLCQAAPNFPSWWIPGEHDKELLEGAAKHGLADTACNIAVDPDYSFGDCIKTSIKLEESPPLKMKSIVKLEKVKTEKSATERRPPGRPRKVIPQPVQPSKEEAEENVPQHLTQDTSGKGCEATPSPKADKKKGHVAEEKSDKEAASQAESQQAVEAQGRASEGTEKLEEEADKVDEPEAKAQSSDMDKALAEASQSILQSGQELANKKEEKALAEAREEASVLLQEEASAETAGKDGVKERPETKEEAARPSSPLVIVKNAASPLPSPGPGRSWSPAELTVAQLLGKSLYAKSWPSDRAIQARLEHICYCVEQNRWPSKRQQEMLSAKIVDESSLTTTTAMPAAVPLSSTASLSSAQLSDSFMDNPDFAMLAAAGHIPGLNGLAETKRRRGRRPRAEIEAERMAQYQAAHQALLQQQQALISAAQAVQSQAQSSRRASSPSSSRKLAHSGAERSADRSEKKSDISRPPPPAHQKVSASQGQEEMEGVLDLTGKGRPSTSSSPSTTTTGNKGKKDVGLERKGEKLSQKVDKLLKKRKQEVETEMDPMDPDGRVPVINLRDGSILQGDKAPKRKDLAHWLMRHDNYVVDTTAFNFPPMVFPEALTNGSMPSSKPSSRDGVSTSSEQQVHLSGEENVTVINRKNGKKMSGRKAPQLKNLGTWLEGNKDFDIDPSWADIIRQDSAAKMRQSLSACTSSKRRKGQETAEAEAEAAAAIFGNHPFAAAFPNLLSGFSNPRMPFAFPPLPPFSMNFSGLMGGMTGEEMMAAHSEKKSGEEGKSSPKKEDKESAKERKKKDKEDKASQQAMDSMMQSQLPFIFPQAGLFAGLHPIFSQGFAGFPFGLPNPLMNGFGGGEEATTATATSSSSRASSEKPRKGGRDKEGTPSQRSALSPAASSEASMRIAERSKASTTSSHKNSASMQRERDKKDKERRQHQEDSDEEASE